MGNVVSPGFGFLKTWQGIVETVLRVACIVLSFIMMICAAVVTGAVNDVEDNLEDADNSVSDRVDDEFNAGSYRSAAGWLIFVAIMAMIIEIAVIIIRILNISFIRLNGIIFRITDAIASAVFALSLFAGAVSNAAYSSDNADTYDEFECDDQKRELEDACNDLRTVSQAQGATAAFAFFAMVAFGALAGFMVYLLITENLNKSRSSDPSSNYREEGAQPDYTE